MDIWGAQAQKHSILSLPEVTTRLISSLGGKGWMKGENKGMEMVILYDLMVDFMEFHGISWNFMGFNKDLMECSWDSRRSCWEFHGISWECFMGLPGNVSCCEGSHYLGKSWK
jgi:hypothetical protein